MKYFFVLLTICLALCSALSTGDQADDNRIKAQLPGDIIIFDPTPPPPPPTRRTIGTAKPVKWNYVILRGNRIIGPAQTGDIITYRPTQPPRPTPPRTMGPIEFSVKPIKPEGNPIIDSGPAVNIVTPTRPPPPITRRTIKPNNNVALL